MSEGQEGFNMWVPANGDIVELKRRPASLTFEGRAESIAFHELGLKEGKLYRVKEYIQDSEGRALSLEEVRVVHIAGERHVSVVRTVPGTPKLDFFQLARMHQAKK